MKKLKLFLLMAVMAIVALSFVACTKDSGGDQTVKSNDALTGESNVLVTYFSWSSSNNTKTMAEYIAEYTGGEIFRIQPKTPYTSNYNEALDVAQTEKSNKVRPELSRISRRNK